VWVTVYTELAIDAEFIRRLHGRTAMAPALPLSGLAKQTRGQPGGRDVSIL